MAAIAELCYRTLAFLVLLGCRYVLGQESCPNSRIRRLTTYPCVSKLPAPTAGNCCKLTANQTACRFAKMRLPGRAFHKSRPARRSLDK